MTLVRGEDLQPLLQRFAKRQRSIHPLIGDVFDLLFKIFPVRMAVEGDLGKYVECLNLCKSAIEIDYEILVYLHLFSEEPQGRFRNLALQNYRVYSFSVSSLESEVAFEVHRDS